MKSRHKHPHRSIRIPDDAWDVLGELTNNRSGLILDFVRWYVRTPDATLPQRPKAADVAQARRKLGYDHHHP